MIKYTEIVEQIKGKNPASMEMLYETYGRHFYAYCIQKWACDEDNAWDIVYRTLETLVLKLDRYEFISQAKFDGFLYRVLMNYIRKSFRSVRVQHGLLLEPVDFNEEELPREVDEQLAKDAFEQYYRDEEIENPAILDLNDALSQMDIEDRDILLLRAQNYSYEEVGELLGIDDDNLKVKYHRAKKKLIQLMTAKQKKGK